MRATESTLPEHAPAAALRWLGNAANEASHADALVPTVFHEPWWLDAATQGDWRTAEVRENGRVVGRLPYALSRHRGFRVSTMPPLTHLLGPAIDAGSGGTARRWLRRTAIVQELVAQLPRLAHFSQTCHPDTADVLAFQSCGFDSFVQFTAELAPAPEAQLWSQMRDKTRNVIRRAQERLHVEAMADPQEFARFYARNLERCGDPSYFDLARIRPLFEAAHARRQGCLLAARGARTGEPACAVFYVWDRQRLWYFLSTRDPGAATNGAVSLLLWQGIRMAARRGLIFDFDGIVGDGIARFYAGFGASFRPRLAVWRSAPLYGLLARAREALRGRNHFVAP